ncbi:MAG: tRNA (guanosine(46)-N7)-methyltransferase TrmB [Granulosicoccus sp.]|nr:tRNA (guanosine(46)-N7)-methyltransferase TrmB [Granulosicoccus sp.]
MDGTAPPERRLTSRSIRSFVVRNGRTTAAQTDALERLLPQFGLPYSQTVIDLSAAFNRQAPTWLEIGFGNGDVLLELAERHPEVNVLGAEVHASGIGHALIGIESRSLSNVRLIHHDAMEVLEHMLEPGSVDRILLLFPDPWPKKRHRKRRIVQPDFLSGVARILQPGGVLHCATDWAEYGEWMLEHLEADDRFANSAGPGKASPRPDWRPVTRFEQRGRRLGHSVTDLLYTRC